MERLGMCIETISVERYVSDCFVMMNEIIVLK